MHMPFSINFMYSLSGKLCYEKKKFKWQTWKKIKQKTDFFLKHNVNVASEK